MASLAVVLGSAAAALEELATARDFLAAHAIDLHVICVNNAIRVCPVKPHAFCTVITSQVAEKRFLEGVDTSGVLLFGRRASSDFPFKVVKPKWQGTSGLYAVQIALDELGFDGVILAGVPIDSAAGTNDAESLMGDACRVARYRPEWLKARPFLTDRVRSMSGWTQQLLGEPTAEWLANLTPPQAVARA